MRTAVVAVAILALGCSKGAQTLYVVNDTGQPLEISVGGEKKERAANEFTPYPSVKLTKGTHIAATNGGAPYDSIELPAIPEDEYVVWIVRGSDNIHLANYRDLYTVGRKEVHLFGPSASQIQIVDPVAPARWVSVPSRAIVVGPSAPLPEAGKVTLGGEKLPILRAERVPEGTTDIPAFLAQKAGAELKRAPK